MSSLESDAADLTLSGGDTGMTQFGFKGASGGDRTGDYRQELVRKKRRLTLVIGIVSAMGVIALLVVLYFVLRAAAPQPKVAQGDPLSETAPLGEAMGNGESPTSNEGETPFTAPTSNASNDGNPSAAMNDAPPFPDAKDHLPGYEDALAGTPPSANGGRPSKALATVKPPTLSSPPAQEGHSETSILDAPNPNHSLNPKVAPGRVAAITKAFKARQFPPTAAERLKMADDFNDIGKVAEANMCYRKAAEAPDATNKEKVLALGGQAVTYRNMGLKSDALTAVNALLALNPNNRFAQKLKSELQ